jgi:hypothetical protein
MGFHAERNLPHPPAPAGYCLASGAARIWRQSGGSCDSVIGGFGFGGTGGGFGCSTASLNQ